MQQIFPHFGTYSFAKVQSFENDREKSWAITAHMLQEPPFKGSTFFTVKTNALKMLENICTRFTLYYFYKLWNYL